MWESSNYSDYMYNGMMVFGVIYVALLMYFCLQHFVTWKKEQDRVRQAVSVFKILALISLGTTLYLFYYIKYGGGGFGGGFGGGGDNIDLTAPTASHATVETTFFSKVTKLFAMCTLILLSGYRILKRL